MIAEAPSQIEGRVHRLFREELELDVDVDTDLISSGILDSLAFVQLLTHLESEFGVEVDVAGLDLDDFASVYRIARFVGGHNGDEAP